MNNKGAAIGLSHRQRRSYIIVSIVKKFRNDRHKILCEKDSKCGAYFGEISHIHTKTSYVGGDRNMTKTDSAEFIGAHTSSALARTQYEIQRNTRRVIKISVFDCLPHTAQHEQLYFIFNNIKHPSSVCF